MPVHLLCKRIKWRVTGDGALVRKRSYELVIHITSIGEFSFLFYFTIFPPLTVHCRGIWNFVLFILIFLFFSFLTNINLSGSLVFVGFLLVVCVHRSLCSGTETLQADWKGLVLQLNKGVKSIFAATRWCPHLKISRANRG